MSDLLNFRNQVYWLVWNIPAGNWLSYGSLAALAGRPGLARQVGGMAHNGPQELPWHRVVKKGGALATGFPGGATTQKSLLQAEGVEFTAEQIVKPAGEWLPQRNLTCPIVVIVGETASGKSSVAMELAKTHNGSIICADSWTVRKGLDIGTAKPTPADQKAIPHYMLDLVAPDEYYSVGLFQVQALEAVQDIVQKGRLSIVTSGNGLYTDSLLYSYSFLDQHNESLRKKLQSMNLQQIQDLAKKLQLDTNQIDIHNKRRLMRLIETDGVMPSKSPVLRPNTLLLGITHSRAELRSRIEQRVEAMFRAGLMREVQDLADQYGTDCEAMKGIGYHEFIDYFSGNKSMSRVKIDIVKSTQGLAKRQRTWFKRNPDINWFDGPENLYSYADNELRKL